jgi:hypothetical protein
MLHTGFLEFQIYGKDDNNATEVAKFCGEIIRLFVKPFPLYLPYA